MAVLSAGSHKPGFESADTSVTAAVVLYGIYDFFNRIPEKGLDSDPAPPFIKVPTAEQAAEQARWTNEVAALELQRRGMLDRKDDDLRRDQIAWEAKQRRNLTTDWLALKPSSASAR